ncbi:glycosyltransferase [Brevibacterium renqingii]|uniref:glycosyltransferase n=1 Tax=Brevibacterium renqingii TaxID=2776916 RepID=UPI001ADFD07E
MAHNGIRHDARVLKGAASLKAHGHDVHIFGLTADQPEDFVLPNNVTVHLIHRDLSDVKARITREQLPPGRENAIWTSFRIQGETIFEGVRSTMTPDIVHMHDHLTLAASSNYKETFGCPLVWDAHEIYEDLASIETVRANVNAQVIQDNVHNVDGFITLNSSIAQYYHRRYPNLPDAVLIPNAVVRKTPPVYDGRLHSAAELESDQKILLFQGGYSPNRGISALLEASQHLSEQWTLVFMGWGKLADEIASYTESATDRPRGRPQVAMIPSVPHDDLLNWTTGATLGAIPYENTGLNHLYCSPNKLWEYPAAGVPVLATDLPEMSQRINKYGIGITVPEDLNPRTIANTVNALSDSNLSLMKQRCEEFAISEDWSSYEDQLVNLHLQLGISAHDRPRSWYKRLSDLVTRIAGTRQRR